MANPLLHKYNAVTTTVPAAGSLVPRELAINTADGKLFTKTDAGTVVEFARKDAVPPLVGTGATGTWPIGVTGASGSTPLLTALATYSWNAATLPAAFNTGIQTAFVQSTDGFQSYGTVITAKGYAAGGGALQLYTPYSPTYGGGRLQARFGNYDVSGGNSWTSWKLLLASDTDPYAYNMNQNVRTTDSPTFASPTFTGTALAPIININRSGNTASGIRWYSTGFTAWCDYMAAPGASQGPTGTITAPAGTLATSWAKRSFIENTAGYGWTFESGTNASTTPVVVAEIRASDGAAKFGGTVTAPTFVGALTGTATSATTLATGADRTKLDTLVGGLVTTPIKTAAYTAVIGDLVRVNSTAGVFTVTMPASPVDGSRVGILDVSNTCATNAVLLAATAGKTIELDATGISINVNGAYIELVYNATGTNWKVLETPAFGSGTLSGTNTGDNAVNTLYANDYRAANFVAGTNYLAPTGSAAGLTSFPTLNQSTTGNAATATRIAGTTTWNFVETAGVLYFQVSGVSKAKLDASGNLTVIGNVTAYGTM